MHETTGEILELHEIEQLPDEERKRFVKVKRDLAPRELLNKRISLYSPCVCGSRKKLKFCCHKP